MQIQENNVTLLLFTLLISADDMYFGHLSSILDFFLTLPHLEHEHPPPHTHSLNLASQALFLLSLK
jgi:hypothetical protein